MVVVVVHSVDIAAAETRVHGVRSWFIECSRTDAEAILTKCHRNGNVMMRPSTSSRVTGRYVISMRSDTGRSVLCASLLLQPASRFSLFIVVSLLAGYIVHDCKTYVKSFPGHTGP